MCWCSHSQCTGFSVHSLCVLLRVRDIVCVWTLQMVEVCMWGVCRVYIRKLHYLHFLIFCREHCSRSRWTSVTCKRALLCRCVWVFHLCQWLLCLFCIWYRLLHCYVSDVWGKGGKDALLLVAFFAAVGTGRSTRPPTARRIARSQIRSRSERVGVG